MKRSPAQQKEFAAIIDRVIKEGGEELRKRRMAPDGTLARLGVTKKDGFYNIFIVGNGTGRFLVRRVEYEIKRRPGRPASGRPRQVQVMFTAREEKRNEMDATAASHGVTRSAWIRDVVYAALKQK